LFLARKEVFTWLKEGAKTIDVRKGDPRQGDTAVFQSGANHLRLYIVNKETGLLEEVVTADNFKFVIPTAKTLEEALEYFRKLYAVSSGVFTAYYLAQTKEDSS
jgi:ASC-1-like (ASCH) protein